MRRIWVGCALCVLMTASAAWASPLRDIPTAGLALLRSAPASGQVRHGPSSRRGRWHRTHAPRAGAPSPSNASGTVLFGDPKVESAMDRDAPGLAEAFSVSDQLAGTARAITVYVDSHSHAAKLIAGLYSDDAGRPGTRLSAGAAISPQPGTWNRVTVPSVPVKSGTTYWLAVVAKGGALALRDRRSNGCISDVAGATTMIQLPIDWPTDGHWSTCRLSAYVSGPASAATSSPTLGAATPTNLTNNAPSATTSTTQAPLLSPPANTALPTISGSTWVGQQLSASTGSWTGSPTTYTYQWEDCDPSGSSCTNILTGITNSYTLSSADIGHTIRVSVSAVGAGGRGVATSTATGVVTSGAPAPQQPSNTSAPVVSGQTVQGDTLTTSTGSWTNSPTSYSYQWQDCNSSGASCSTISGATSNTYTLASSDVGHTIVATVTATNAGGSGSARSAPTAIVTANSGGGGTGQSNCMSQLQSGSIYPAWQSVAACGYPAPTSIDPNGLSSGGTAGVPDGTALRNAKTCGCLPAGDSWSSSGYVYVDSTATLSDLYVPGGIVIANSSVGPLTIQDVDVEGAPGGDGYLVNGQSDSGVTIKNSWIHTTYSGKSCTQTTSYSTQNYGVGHFGSVVLQDDDIDCFGIPVIGSNLTISGSVIISEGMSSPSHNEAIYSESGDSITGNTIVNPEPQTADFFGDQNCGGCGTLTNITIADNLVAGNQNNGAFAIGCTATGSYQMDFGHGPNVNIVVAKNRFSNVYNVNPPGGRFAAGNTDRGSGTTWSGNYLDNDLSTVAEPVRAC